MPADSELLREMADLEIADPEIANPEIANPEMADPEMADPKMANLETEIAKLKTRLSLAEPRLRIAENAIIQLQSDSIEYIEYRLSQTQTINQLANLVKRLTNTVSKLVPSADITA